MNLELVFFLIFIENKIYNIYFYRYVLKKEKIESNCLNYFQFILLEFYCFC